MFSSTNTLNPFPQQQQQQQYYFPPSSHPHHLPPPSPPILNQEVAATATVTPTASATVSDDILFHHDPLSAPFLLNISPLIPDTSVINLGVSNSAGTMTKQDMCNLYGGHNHHHHDHHHHHHHLDGGVPRFLPRKPMKKDRHSKIYTAQGLRDRRVRLSIEIAREFFDLQDMLGFDKASKTLEWLLSKSKKAIKDLARTKLSSTSCAKSSSLTSECEGDEEEQEQEQEDNEQANNEVVDNNEIILEGTVVSKRKKMLKEKNMRKLDEAAAALQHLRTAKESRAKARARARERTREKMCTVLKIHDPKKCPPTLHPSSTNPSSSQILNQLRTMNQFHGCERSSPKIVATAEIIEAIQESSSSIMSRRKLQKPTLISSFQQQHHHHQQLNEISSKGGQTSNDNNNTNNNTNSMFCPNLPQNWDINSPLIATTRPSFRTITNMNLSTELQIYGKTMGGQ